MADGLHALQLHDLVRQPPPRPSTRPGRRSSQSSRAHLRFPRAIQKWRCPRRLTLHPLQGQVKSVHHKSLANIFDGLNTTPIRRAKCFVRPPQPVRIRLQQDLSTTHLLRCPLQPLDHLITNPTLRIGQSNEILLAHPNLLVQQRFSTFHPSRSTPNLRHDGALEPFEKVRKAKRILRQMAVDEARSVTLND